MSHSQAIKKHLDTQKLLKIWSKKSSFLFKKLTSNFEIKSGEYKPQFPIYGYWLTFSDLTSPTFNIQFKLFYNTDQASGFCAPIFKTSANKITDDQLKDFMKEFCNLVIGRIKYDLKQNNLTSSSALPISLRSFDNLFFNQNEHNQNYRHFWRLYYQNSEIICYLSCEIQDLVATQNLNIEVSDDIEEGGFEIL